MTLDEKVKNLEARLAEAEAQLRALKQITVVTPTGIGLGEYATDGVQIRIL